MVSNRSRIAILMTGWLLVLCVGASRTARAQVDLYVGTHNFNEPTFHYNGTTGALINSFGSFANERGEGIAVRSNGDLYVSYFDSGLIRRWNASNGTLLDTFNPNDGTLSALRFGPNGLLYGLSASHLFRYDASSDSGLVVFNGNGIGSANNYQRLAFGPDGSLYVSSITGNASADGVQRFDPTTGAYLGQFILHGSGGLNEAEGLAFDASGNLDVVDYLNARVLRFNGTTGAFMGVFIPSGSGGLVVPQDITFGPDGNVYVSDIGGHDVLRYNGTTGAFIDDFVTPGSGGLVRPESLAFHVTTNASTPEPGPLALLGGAVAVLSVALRRRAGIKK